MPVARLVVIRRPLGNRPRKRRRIQRLVSADAGDPFDEIEKRPSVAAGHIDQQTFCFRSQRQRNAEQTFRAHGKHLQILPIQRLEHHDLHSGQQRSIKLERRIFGRRADQNHRPLFDVGQKPVLLRFVETMYFIGEQNSPEASEPSVAGRSEDFLQVCGICVNRADLHEVEFRMLCDQPCYGGFSDARRPPQDHRGQRPGCEHQSDRTVLVKNVGLSQNLSESLRAQLVRKRSQGHGFGVFAAKIAQHCRHQFEICCRHRFMLSDYNRILIAESSPLRSMTMLQASSRSSAIRRNSRAVRIS